MRRWGKALVGLTVTVALLWWTLAGVDFREVLTNIGQGDFVLLGASIVVTTFGFVVRAMRWAVFLEPVRPRTSLHTRFTAVAIHFMANNVIPLRVGEFARAWVLSRLEPVKASAAFGTVVVERFVDGIVLLVFLVLPVFTPGFPRAAVLTEGVGALLFRAAVIGVVVVVTALIVMAAFPRHFVAAGERVAPLLPRAVREPILYALGSFLDSLASLRNPRLMAVAFVWTFAFWALQAASFWLGMLAFGIETGYVSALFTSSVVAFIVAIPSAPGFFGPFQFGAAFALSDVYGVGDGQSLAFAFGWHFGAWIPITVIGLYYVWRLGLTLGDVGAAEERLERPEAFADDGPG